MLRSWSSSQRASVGVLAIVGSTDRSMRSRTPASSSRRNRSSRVVASAAACIVLATRPRNTGGSGWTRARLSIHGSRGRTQQIAPGSTPWASSQTHASVAVFPDPTTTYWPAGSVTRVRAFTGITRAPLATSNGGGVWAGMSGAR